MSDWGRAVSVVARPRTGIGELMVAGPDGGALLVAFDIAAFRTREYGGLTPHVEHGVKGVRSLAVVGSKCEGTGFEKAQMGQIQVAMLAGDDSGGGR